MAKVGIATRFENGQQVGPSIKFNTVTERLALLRLDNVPITCKLKTTAVETKSYWPKFSKEPIVARVVPVQSEVIDNSLSNVTIYSTALSRHQSQRGNGHDIIDNPPRDEVTNPSNGEATMVHRLTEDYEEDIEEYLYELERSCRRGDILKKQNEVTESMRMVLINWLVKVHHAFKFSSETLYLTVFILDSYLLRKSVSRCLFQLLGVTSFFVASKYEEGYPPNIYDLVYLTDKACTIKDVLKMELKVLKALDFDLGRSLSVHFLNRFVLRFSVQSRSQMESLARYILELTFLDVSVSRYLPSRLAASALVLADEILSGHQEEGLFLDEVCSCARVTKDDLQLTVQELGALLKSSKVDEYSIIKKKYSQSIPIENSL